MTGSAAIVSSNDLAKLRSVGYDNTMTAVPDGVEMYVGNYLSQPDIYR